MTAENPFAEIAERLSRIEAVLTAKTSAKEVGAMNLSEAAKFLKISNSKLYALCQAGEIPTTKIGSRWLFLPSALTEWMKKNQVRR